MHETNPKSQISSICYKFFISLKYEGLEVFMFFPTTEAIFTVHINA